MSKYFFVIFFTFLILFVAAGVVKAENGYCLCSAGSFYCEQKDSAGKCGCGGKQSQGDYADLVTCAQVAANMNQAVQQLEESQKKSAGSDIDIPLVPLTDYGSSVEDLKSSARSLNKTNWTSISDIIGKATNMLMVYIGSISLVLYIWAGFLWMTSAGNADRAGKGKQIVVWTTLGVVVMLSAYIIVGFILNIVKPGTV